jgi:hypothetical protein
MKSSMRVVAEVLPKRRSSVPGSCCFVMLLHV